MGKYNDVKVALKKNSNRFANEEEREELVKNRVSEERKKLMQYFSSMKELIDRKIMLLLSIKPCYNLVKKGCDDMGLAEFERKKDEK